MKASRPPQDSSSLPPSAEDAVHRHNTQGEVMDVLPWPNGYGFTGSNAWWCHVLGQSERERLDSLIGLALLDDKICEQLVTHRDPELLSTFGLPEQAQHWLIGLKASTLKDFAQAIVAASTPSYLTAASSEAAQSTLHHD